MNVERLEKCQGILWRKFIEGIGEEAYGATSAHRRFALGWHAYGYIQGFVQGFGESDADFDTYQELIKLKDWMVEWDSGRINLEGGEC